jgi:N utilization substance protein A
VKRVEFGNVTVDLGRGEASCAATSCCRGTFRAGDRVRALIYDVREQRGPQIFLSRTATNS